MIATSIPQTCKTCGRPITQTAGGHRKREYCDSACKMRDRRQQEAAREREKALAILRSKFGDFLPETLQTLENVMRFGSVELAEQVATALVHEISAVSRDAHIEIVALRLQIQELQNKLAMIQDREERFRTDTQAHNFTSWLTKHAPYYAQTPFGRKFLDKNAGLPPRGSRGTYEARIRSSGDYFTTEDVETFREAWKAMLIAEK